MAPKKSHPMHVTPTNPSPNFVQACAINHGEDYFQYMYGNSGVPFGANEAPKASGYGHGVGQRAGKLRLSGNSKAHRIGKR